MRINVTPNLGLILTKNAKLRHMSVAALIGWMTYETLGDCSHPTTVTQPQLGEEPTTLMPDEEWNAEWAQYTDK